MTELEIERSVEALLFAAAEPLSLDRIAARLPDDTDVADAIARLQARHAGRGVELQEVAGGWRFSTAPDLAHLMVERQDEPRRLSKAAYEVLAVIAYHQPATRAEIEGVRGVSLSSGSLDALLAQGWVRARGRRRSPGRPLTYATTPAFLEHFGLATLADLPRASDMRAAGLLSLDLGPNFQAPDPSTVRAGDEDPIEPDDEAPQFVRDYLGAS